MDTINTKFYVIDEENCDKYLTEAAEVLKRGGLVAFPTETVYGLGANGLNGKAVTDIFKAKGRPNDNPLILHIHDRTCVDSLVCEINQTAKLLMDNFWPGPLTLVFKKNANIPNEVTAGLDTVAIRLPENEIARKLIAFSNLPVAAPSANTSGRPSPTKAKHVLEDLNGKIDVIIDGGSCLIGVESTVVDVTGNNPIILRPGKVTFEQIKKLIPTVSYDKHLIDKTETAKPKSPGMKYKHYAPKGELYIVKGIPEKVKEYITQNISEKVGVLTFDEYLLNVKNEYSLGETTDLDSACNRLFDILRTFDAVNADIIYAFMPSDEGVGFAVCNRLLKAAGGKIIEV